MPRTEHRHLEPDVSQPIRSAPTKLPWYSRLLDGTHPWGSFDATVSRYGLRRYRLIVYPPGTSTADRRLARLWRGWPITGAALGLLAVMLLGNRVASADRVLALAVAVYVSISGLLVLRAGPARVRVRSMSVLLMPGTDDARECVRFTELRALVRALTGADNMVRSGVISLVEHEATWWEAYNRLEATDA